MRRGRYSTPARHEREAGRVADGTGTFQERIEALVGRPMGHGAAAPDPVNLPMIRHWVAAFDDHNPVYLDAEAATAAGHPGIVAPPMMLQTWTMPTPVLEGIGARGGAPVPVTGESPIAVFDEAGFTGTLASNSEFEIERYLRVGETVTATNTLESVSEEKQTRLGPGHFVTWVTTFRDEQGEVVGRQRFRILKFKPGEAGR
jgi:acyl dehydratase